MARVHIEINQTAIEQLVTNPASPIYRHMVAVGATVSAVAKVKASVDTGRLRQSIDFELISRPPELTARVFAPVDYAEVVHEGHGEIRPRRAKVLRWRGKDGEYHYARRVRPVAGNPFLVDAVKEVTGKTPRRGR